jgi:hypothetical protein
LELGNLFHTLAHLDQSVRLASPCGSVFDLAKYVMQVCPLSYQPKTPLKALVVGYEKRAKIQKCLWWGIIHIERSSEWFEELTFLLQKITKPPDRWLIKEWMIGNSVITVLSSNCPRTSKGYKPHKHQGKSVDKMPTYLKCDGILCYRHGTCELYRHKSKSWSTTKYLAVCLGWAKVKLGGFVGGH